MEALACEEFSEESIHLFDFVFSDKRSMAKIKRYSLDLDRIFDVLRRTCYKDVEKLNERYDIRLEVSSSYIIVKYNDAGISLSFPDLFNWYKKYTNMLSKEDDLVCLNFFDRIYGCTEAKVFAQVSKYAIINYIVSDESEVRKAFLFTEMCTKTVNKNKACTKFDILVKDDLIYIMYLDRVVRIDFSSISGGELFVSYAGQYDLMSFIDGGMYIVCFKGELFYSGTCVKKVEFSTNNMKRVSLLGDFKHITLYG